MFFDIVCHDHQTLGLQRIDARSSRLHIPGILQESLPETAQKVSHVKFVSEGFLPADLHDPQDVFDHLQMRE